MYQNFLFLQLIIDKVDPDLQHCTLFLESIRGEEDLEQACRPQQYRLVDPGCLASKSFFLYSSICFKLEMSPLFFYV